MINRTGQNDNNQQVAHVEPVGNGEQPVRKFNFQDAVVRLLIAVYLVLALVSCYWYLARPVRAEQVSNAYEWCFELMEIHKLPVPEDQRWPW